MEKWISNLFFFGSIYLEIVLCVLLYFLAQSQPVAQSLKRLSIYFVCCLLILISPKFIAVLTWQGFGHLCAAQPQFRGLDIGMAWVVMIGTWVNHFLSAFCAMSLCISFFLSRQKTQKDKN